MTWKGERKLAKRRKIKENQCQLDRGVLSNSKICQDWAGDMNSLSQIPMLVAAMCPVSWILSLFAGADGKLTAPGYNLPSGGFGLLAFFCLIQVAAVAVLSAMSFRYEELREVSTLLLIAALAAMTCFSLFSYVFAKSRFAVSGVWHGLVGLLAMAAGQVVQAI